MTLSLQAKLKCGVITPALSADCLSQFKSGRDLAESYAINSTNCDAFFKSTIPFDETESIMVGPDVLHRSYKASPERLRFVRDWVEILRTSESIYQKHFAERLHLNTDIYSLKFYTTDSYAYVMALLSVYRISWESISYVEAIRELMDSHGLSLNEALVLGGNFNTPDKRAFDYRWSNHFIYSNSHKINGYLSDIAKALEIAKNSSPAKPAAGTNTGFSTVISEIQREDGRTGKSFSKVLTDEADTQSAFTIIREAIHA